MNTRNFTIAEIDVDDTCIPWEAPHAIAYPAMASAISLETGIDYEEIVRQIKKVNTRHGTIEYTPLIQSMDSFSKMPRQEILKLIDVAYETKNSVIECYAKTYEGVETLLDTLSTQLYTRARSDAPIHLCHKRLKIADLLQYLKAIHAMPSPPTHLFPEKYRQTVYEVPTKIVDQAKPHTDIKKDTGLTPEQHSACTFMIGNSSKSDEGYARKNGMLFYKTNWDNATPHDRAVLQQFAPDKVLARNIGIEYQDDEIVTKSGFEKVEVSHPLEILQDLIRRKIIKYISYH